MCTNDSKKLGRANCKQILYSPRQNIQQVRSNLYVLVSEHSQVGRGGNKSDSANESFFLFRRKQNRKNKHVAISGNM